MSSTMMYWSMDLKIKKKIDFDAVKQLLATDADAQYYELYADENTFKVECDDCEATLDDEKWERICNKLVPYVNGELYFKDEYGSTFWKMILNQGRFEVLEGEIMYGDEIDSFLTYNKQFLSPECIAELERLQIARKI